MKENSKTEHPSQTSLISTIEQLTLQGKWHKAQSIAYKAAKAMIIKEGPYKGIEFFSKTNEIIFPEVTEKKNQVYLIGKQAEIIRLAGNGLRGMERIQMLQDAVEQWKCARLLAKSIRSDQYKEKNRNLTYHHGELAKTHRLIAQTMLSLTHEENNDDTFEIVFQSTQRLDAETWQQISFHLKQAENEAKWVDRAKDPLGRIILWCEQAIQFSLQGRIGLLPHLDAEEAALEKLHYAVREIDKLLWGKEHIFTVDEQGYRRFKQQNVKKALRNKPEKQQKLIRKQVPFLLRNLGQRYSYTGRKGLAGWLYAYAEEYYECDRKKLSQLDRAFNEQDLNLWVAITRLEKILASDPYNISVRNSEWVQRRFGEASLQLGNLLEYQGARISACYYWKKAQEFLREDPSLGARASSYMIPVIETDEDFAFANTEQTESSLDDLLKSLEEGLKQRRPFSVAQALRRIGKYLAFLPTGSLDNRRQASLTDAIESTFTWHPPQRTKHLPEDIEIPKEWSQNVVSEAIFCLRLALEFAEHYGSGLLPRIFSLLAKIAKDDQSLLEETANIAIQKGHWQIAAYTCHALAQKQAKNDPETAILWADKARKQALQGLNWLGFGADKHDVLADWSCFLEKITETLVDAGGSDELLFEVVEQSKGQALIAARLGLPSQLPAERRNKLRDLRLKEFAVSQEIQQFEETKMGHNIRGRDETIKELRSNQLEYQREIRSILDSFRRDGYDCSVPWLNFSNRALSAFSLLNSRGVALIHYFCNQTMVWAVIAKTGMDGEVRYLSARLGDWKEIKLLIKVILEDLDASSIPFTSKQHSRHKKAYDLLFAPIASYLDDVDTLFIIPFTHLPNIPIHVLIEPSGKYVIERYQIGYTPCANLLLHLVQTSRCVGKGALCLGWHEDKIGVYQEVRQVTRLLRRMLSYHHVQAPSEVATGVKFLLDNRKWWSLIHVGAHGEHYPDKGSMDAVIKFPDQEVSARDIFLGGARAQLVFLNICHAGRQTPRSGDLYGFPFALLSAGSLSAIVASVPINPDFAAHFAERFYCRLAHDNVTKLIAFTDTMRDMIKDSQWSHPAYWGPYFFVGDPQDIVWHQNYM